MRFLWSNLEAHLGAAMEHFLWNNLGFYQEKIQMKAKNIFIFCTWTKIDQGIYIPYFPMKSQEIVDATLTCYFEYFLLQR